MSYHDGNALQVFTVSDENFLLSASSDKIEVEIGIDDHFHCYDGKDILCISNEKSMEIQRVSSGVEFIYWWNLYNDKKPDHSAVADPCDSQLHACKVFVCISRKRYESRQRIFLSSGI